MAVFEVNLSSLKNNIRYIKTLIGAGTELMAVVKSDAYGLGINKIVKKCMEEGVKSFGVSHLDEVEKVRKITNEDVKIYYLSPPNRDIFELAFEGKVIPIIGSFSDLHLLKNVSKRKSKKTAVVHFGIDTGMGRMGFSIDDYITAFEELRDLKNVKVSGLFSHFHSADEEKDNDTEEQIKIFSEITHKLENILGSKLVKHISNSAGVFSGKDCLFDMVRCGISLYGASSGGFAFKGIKRVVSVKSVIASVKKIPKGHGISYGKTFIAENDMIIGLIDTGYGEGFFRSLSSTADVLVKGQRARIVGRVTMDIIIADITNIKNVEAGDEVVIIGEQGNECITVEELSQKAGAIPYEFFCAMGKMMKRNYVE